VENFDVGENYEGNGLDDEDFSGLGLMMG